MQTIARATCTAAPRPGGAHARRRPGIRKRMERDLATISALRTSLEKQRHRELWDIANKIDDLVKQELESLESVLDLPDRRQTTDDEVIDVEFK